MKSELEKIAHMCADVHVDTKEQRRKRQKLLIIDLLIDYAKNSTLHGFRYIVEHGLTIVEKIFWVMTIIVSVVLCSFYIVNVYQKWITSPVIVTVNERLSSVGTVPFPSVTICPVVRVNPMYYNYTDLKKRYFDQNLTAPEQLKLQHVAMMCDLNSYLYTKFWFLNDDERYLGNISLVDDITDAAPTLSDLFFNCEWYNSSVTNCHELFQKVYTKEGVCFTANSLAANEIFENNTQKEYSYLESKTPSIGWTIENGYYYNNYSVQSYPWRGSILGSKPDMEIVLRHDPGNHDIACNSILTGYKIFLHHPADYPQSSSYYYASLPNDLTSLAISFHEFNTDASLSSYPPEIRQCYFPEDKKLRFFKIYTAKNCQAECLSNYTLKVCKCVGFFMPHDNSSQLCGPNTDLCLIRAKDLMALAEINVEIGKKDEGKEGCRCLPACNTIEYDAETVKAQYNYKNFSPIPGVSYSKIELYFKKPQFVTMQRRELFGVTDLLANIGGLLGLFLGFSFLSLIEIIYFVTLRVGFTLKRDLEQEKSKNTSK